MDPKIIGAIAGLWKLALVGSCTFLAFVFRKPIKSWMLRLSLFKFKRGQTELEVRHGNKEVEERPSETEKKAAPATPSAELAEKTSQEAATTSDDWGLKMIDAFLSRNAEEAEGAFKRLQDSETDARKKLQNQLHYLWLRYQCAGDASGLDKLKELAKREEISADAHFWIGRCYETAGQFEKAATAYETAAELSDTEEKRAKRVRWVADCLKKDGKHEEAISRVIREIGRTSTDSAIAVLYETLASLYEAVNNPELRAVALEKVLEKRPNDTRSRFGAAYSYSKKEFHALSLLHYQILLNFTPEDASALNNIAVQYADMGMPMKSVSFYKTSAELSETLAMANLAQKYMVAGFEEEAMNLLNKAKEQPDVHPNVGAAIAAISKRAEGEKEEEEKNLKAAREQQRFMISFGEAFFTEGADCPAFGGLWRFPDGAEATMVQDGYQITAEWTRDKKRFKFIGRPRNRGAQITNYEMGLINWVQEEWGFTETGRGYIYLSSKGREVFVMNLRGTETSFITLDRFP